MTKLNFRKRVFQIAKQIGRTISTSAKMYDVRDDFKKLPERNKNKLTGGVKLFIEPVVNFTKVDKQLDILCTFKEQVEKQGFAFLPIFESENFIQGLMFRPNDDTWIDAAWNRMFYANHCVNLFKGGYDPTLAGIADILYDSRSGLFCNWDSRHRAVGSMSASKDQLPKYGWNNALVIKSTAPTKGSKPIFADEVACYLFEKKNDSPKPLTPVERFVAEYRTNDPSAIGAYNAFKYAKLKLGTDVLPELEALDDARTLTGVSQFRNDYTHPNVGRGDNLVGAVEALKKVWTGSQVPEFSVFLVLGCCHLIQMHKTYNGAWGFKEKTMIEALKWAYEKKGLQPRDYCTPRENGKPYESVAFHFIRLAYNEYCKEKLKDKDSMLSYEHFGFKDSFLATIGVDPKDMKENEEIDDSSISEEFNIPEYVVS